MDVWYVLLERSRETIPAFAAWMVQRSGEILCPRYKAVRYRVLSSQGLRPCEQRSSRTSPGGTSWGQPVASTTVGKKSWTCGAASATRPPASPGKRIPWCLCSRPPRGYLAMALAHSRGLFDRVGTGRSGSRNHEERALIRIGIDRVLAWEPPA